MVATRVLTQKLVKKILKRKMLCILCVPLLLTSDASHEHIKFFHYHTDVWQAAHLMDTPMVAPEESGLRKSADSTNLATGTSSDFEGM